MHTPPTLLSLVSAEGEQQWNQAALAAPLAAPRLALWQYGVPAVVLGCLQKPPEPEQRPLPMVKRAAGGGAVLVGPWMLSLSVALPMWHPLAAGGLIESYRWLGELIARVLQDFGIAAQALPPSALPPKDDRLRWACFGSLSPWEVVVAGRKIAGLAQRRSSTCLLLVAGILVGEPDWPLLGAAMERDGYEASRLEEATTSCAAELGRPLSLFSLATALEAAIDDRLFPTEAIEPSRQAWQKDIAAGEIRAASATSS